VLNFYAIAQLYPIAQLCPIERYAESYDSAPPESPTDFANAAKTRAPSCAFYAQRPAGWCVLSLFLLAIAFLIFPTNARAQNKPPDLTNESIEDLMNIEVYSASKHMQSVSDAPASVTVVTADQIQKYGYRTLADILQSVRGFYMTSDRDYSFVGVRGFGRLGDSNNRILVLIDGHRINDNVFGEPYLGTEFLVDVDLIERVEIIRGPSSSLYGADAFFAVINVITVSVWF
jgi:outer membrane receptor for ferrienterochelin and colicin